MKPQPINPRFPKPPTSPWPAIMMIVTLALLMLFFVIFATGCTTTTVTTTSAKGGMVVTKTTAPPAGLVTAIGIGLGVAIDTAFNSLINQSNR